MSETFEEWRVQWLQREMDRVAAEMTRDFLRPALKAAGVEDPQRYQLAYDHSSTLRRRPMATIVHMPDRHRCHTELHALGRLPVGTVAECSCGKRYVMRDDQRDLYWELEFGTQGDR